MEKNPENENGFSYFIPIKSIKTYPIHIKCEASLVEREKLSQIWDVLLVKDLHAELQLFPWRKVGVRVVGTVYAEIKQICVVTLEPVLSLIKEPLEYIFVPDDSKLLCTLAKDRDEVLFGWQDPDILTFSKGGLIDIGAAIAESAALAIDPYPKKEEAVFIDRYGDNGHDNRRASHFEALKNWKKG